MSPRNTAEAIIKLLKETSCHRLLATTTTLHCLIEEIRGTLLSTDPDFAVVTEEVPSLLEIYPKLGHEVEQDPFELYPAGPRPSLDDIGIYLHSSGSTGLPKSIPETFRTIVHWAAFRVSPCGSPFSAHDLYFFLRSPVHQLPRATSSTSNSNSTSSLLPYVRLWNSSSRSVILLTDRGVVPSSGHNRRCSTYATYSTKCHRAYQTGELRWNVRHPCLASNLGSGLSSCRFPDEA